MATFAKLNADIRGTIELLDQAITKNSQAVEAISKTSELVMSKGAEAKQGLEDIKKSADESRSYLERVFSETKGKTKSDFDELIEMLKAGHAEMAPAIAQIAEQVQSGDITLKEFLKAFGNLIVTMEGGGKTIKELVANMDLASLQSDIQNAKDEMGAQITGIEDLMGRLTKVNSEAARQLLMILDLWRKGKVEMDEVLLYLQRLKQATPGDGSATDALMDEIEDFLTSSGRGGG